MQCRQCGTEIADKALICYRCGTATTEAKYKPAPIGGRRSPGRLVLLIVLILVALAGVFVAETAAGDSTRVLGWVVAVAAVAALVVGRVSRRR